MVDSKFINAEDNSMTKPMEISEENRQPPDIRKRKADDMEDVGDGEGSDVSSREEGQEWGVDSFEEDEFKPTKKLDPNDEEAQKMRRYRIEMYQSNGFNVNRENYPGRVAYHDLYPVNLDVPFRSSGLTGREYVQNMVALAVERYNRVKGMTLTWVSIVRAIMSSIPGVKLYITFMARETPDGDLVEYQAKTQKRAMQKHAHVLFCRPAPKPKVIQIPMDEDCVTSSSSSGDASSRESGQEWDVDSLDDESDYKPPSMLAPTQEEIQKMRLYRPQMYRTKGFNVDGESYSGRVIYFSQLDLDEPFYNSKVTSREQLRILANMALERYNQIKGSSVTCESIVRGILTKVTGFKVYITFMARESPGGDLVEYQAKTERRFWQSKNHVILCRPAPKPKAA